METRRGLRLALLAFAQFIIAIDYNIVYVALPDIGRALGFSAQSLQWVVSAYAVGFGGFLLIGGRAVDRLGPRRVFVLALVVYAGSSLVGGLASDPGLLVTARAVQGLGGALLFPATLALISISFAEGRERNRAMGVWGAAGSSGLAAGALAGGLLTSGLGWPWVFYVNVPLALGAALGALWLLPADRSRGGRRVSFDLPGALIATGGVTLVVLGLASGPEAGWGSVRGAGSLAVGAVLLGAFLLVERRTRDPLVPLRMFGNRTMMTAAVVIFVYMGALSTVYYLLTTYVQNVLGYNALRAGLAFLPLGLLAAVGAGKVAARSLNRWGHRTTLSIAMLGVSVGTVAMVLGMSTGGSYLALVPGVVLWGVFGGVTFVTMFVAAASGVAPGEEGVASAIASTSQQIGAAVGLAALIAVANAGLDTGVGATPSAADTVAGLRAAGWATAAAVLVGALLALTLKRRSEAQDAPVADTVLANAERTG